MVAATVGFVGHFFFTIQSRSRKLRLIEKPKIREVLVLIYGFKLFDEVQCVLLVRFEPTKEPSNTLLKLH